MLYGRFATSAVGPERPDGRSARRNVRMSRLYTVSRRLSLLLNARQRSAATARPAPGRSRPRSPRRPRSKKDRASASPRPGPTSSTWSPRPTPDADGDPANSVAVMNEILPQRFSWAKVELLRQSANLGAAEQPDRQRVPRSCAAHRPRAPALTCLRHPTRSRSALRGSPDRRAARSAGRHCVPRCPGRIGHRRRSRYRCCRPVAAGLTPGEASQVPPLATAGTSVPGFAPMRPPRRAPASAPRWPPAAARSPHR